MLRIETGILKILEILIQTIILPSSWTSRQDDGKVSICHPERSEGSLRLGWDSSLRSE